MNWSNTTCEGIEEYKSRIYPKVYSIVFIFGFVTNAFCLYVFSKYYQKRDAHIIMMNLAVADLMFVCTLPFRIHYYLQCGKWILGDFLCRLSSYALYVNLYCSILFLTVMSVLRYLAVVHPLKVSRLRSVKSALLICVAIWCFVGSICSTFLVSHFRNSNTTKCFEPEATNRNNMIIMNWIALILGCGTPLCIIVVCYIFILKTLLMSKERKQNQNKSNRKATAMIIIVICIFFSCFLPYHIVRTLFLARMQNVDLQKYVVITSCFVAINTCLDPLLYYFGAENFREKVKTQIQKLRFRLSCNNT